MKRAALACALALLGSASVSATPRDEAATITGTIHCTNCGSGERFPITAAGSATTTDDAGAFTLAVVARGKVDVLATLTPGYAPQRLATVRLTGKRRYDLGTVTVEAPDGE